MSGERRVGSEVDLASVVARLNEALGERGLEQAPAYRISGSDVSSVIATIKQQLNELQAINRPRTDFPPSLAGKLPFRLPFVGKLLRRAVLSLHARAFTDQRRINGLIIESLAKMDQELARLANRAAQLDDQLIRERFGASSDDQ
jgi:hypothetical protein